MPSLVEIGLLVLEKKMKMWKVHHDDDDDDDRQTTEKYWSIKLTWAFGSGELKTEMFSDLELSKNFHN